jgi:hypothetical protein
MASLLLGDEPFLLLRSCNRQPISFWRAGAQSKWLGCNAGFAVQLASFVHCRTELKHV